MDFLSFSNILSSSISLLLSFFPRISWAWCFSRFMLFIASFFTAWLTSFNSRIFGHTLLELFSAKPAVSGETTGSLFLFPAVQFGFSFFHFRKCFFKFSYHSCPSCPQSFIICSSFLELSQKTVSLLIFPASPISTTLMLFSTVSELVVLLFLVSHILSPLLLFSIISQLSIYVVFLTHVYQEITVGLVLTNLAFLFWFP